MAGNARTAGRAVSTDAAHGASRYAAARCGPYGAVLSISLQHGRPPWLWYERRLLDDSALAAILGDPAVDLYVLYVGGQPAGYVELDARRRGEVELAYLGLMEPFIGRGLGRYLVGWGVRRAWDRHPDRIWVHTCTFDHPAALGSYQKTGFAPFKRETKRIPDPRPLK